MEKNSPPPTTVLPNSLQCLIDNGLLEKFTSSVDNCVLYCRHSDRPTLPPASPGFKVPLTELGVLKAKLLGSALKKLSIKPGPVILCSPMTRTVETLSAIADGAGWKNLYEAKVEIDERVLGNGVMFQEGVTLMHVIDEIRKRHGGTNLSIMAEPYEFHNHIIAASSISDCELYPGLKPFKIAFRNTLALVMETLDRKMPEPGIGYGVGTETGIGIGTESGIGSGFGIGAGSGFGIGTGTTSETGNGLVIGTGKGSGTESGTDLIQEGQSDRYLSMIVGHDLQVAMLLSGLFGMTTMAKETWPPFLDSILFAKLQGEGTNGIVAVYGDRVVEVDLSLI